MNIVQILVTEDELYLLHEAFGQFLPWLAEMNEAGVDRRDDLEAALDLDSRIKGRIADLVVAAGGDPT